MVDWPEITCAPDIPFSGCETYCWPAIGGLYGTGWVTTTGG